MHVTLHGNNFSPAILHLTDDDQSIVIGMVCEDTETAGE
jgi:hypothetical protein